MLILPSRIQRCGFFVAFLVTFLAIYCATGFNNAVGGSAETVSASKKTVLVLHGDRLAIPAVKTTDQGLMAALSRARPEEVEIFSEYLDLVRFPATQYADDVVRYLRARYAARKPDVVIAVGNSLELVLAHRDELFAGVPIVFANVDHREVEGKEMPPNVSGLWMAWDYQRTVELALQLQPETREIVCVTGTGSEEQRWNSEARKVLGRFATRVRSRWLDKLPLSAVLDEVGQLPPDSVVLYIPMQRDGAGKVVSPFEVARQLAQASRVPVYGLSAPQLEQGIIGGALLDFSEIGQKTAALAFRVLAGESPPVLSPPDPGTNPLLVNWRALKKWHVSESRIPTEATVRYREPTLWEQHRDLILATAAIFGLQSMLIVGLIVQRSRLKRAEGSLRESEERMSLAADAANLGMWLWDVAGDKIWMTEKGRALFGLAPDAYLDDATLITRVHPDDRAERAAAIRQAIETQGEYAMEYRAQLPDGTLRWIGTRGRCLNGVSGKSRRLLGVSMDVTAQKLAQEALRESEARFRSMANTAPVMIWMSGTDKLCTFFNKGWLDFTGRPLEEELGNGWAEGVHIEDFDGCLKVYLNSFNARQPFTMEYRLRRSDGEYRWVLDNGAPRFASDDTFLGFIGSCIDITERRQAQERFRLVVEASPNGIVLFNAQGDIVLVNARAEKLFGYERQELIGQNVDLVMPERFRGESLSHRAGFHAATAAQAVGAGLELSARHKDGTEFPVEIGSSLIEGPEGTLVLSVIVDVSVRKQAEAEARQHREELAHLSRVAIMGEMAGSLAHELNQPLTGIVNNASAGRRFIAKGRADFPKLDSLFEAVVADGRRAGEIIRGIRSMVRKGEVVRDAVNLNDVIASVLQFVRSDALGRQCALISEPDPRLPLVEGDQVQLQQVLLNLVVNAIEAMDETPVADRRVIVRSECDSGGRARVSVRDFGIGLPVEEPQRIFERFFSTKREGMGMGLAIARSIVAAHGGELAAANAQSGGACVHFSLPLIAEGQRDRESSQMEGEREA
jgi:two-component system, LuxR family, sensor kinase FixL